VKIAGFFDEYGWLSNFHVEDVTCNGITFKSVEHAFQAAKTTDETRAEEIRDAETPKQAKKLGRKKDLPMRPDWETKKIPIMREFVRAKFLNPNLRQKLLATGDAELVEENFWGDVFWGTVKGVGENNLGKILMEVRAEIRAEIQEPGGPPYSGPGLSVAPKEDWQG
jgi:ribA/ribD-fused uncharacterized protein